MGPITKEGLSNLKQEMDRLKKEFDSLPDVIADARSKGDLKENAEYHAARERQGLLKAMIAKISSDIALSQVIDPKELPEGVVTFGKLVKLKNKTDGTEDSYTIVGNAEVDLMQKKISVSSVIAKAILGKAVGETIKVTVPSGEKTYSIEAIDYMS